MLSCSVSAFPETPATSSDAGIPIGCVVRPLADLGRRSDSYDDDEEDKESSADSATSVLIADEIGRCDACGAYINPYCSLLNRTWRCALCGGHNPLGSRYASNLHGRAEALHELSDYAIELDFTDGASRGEWNGGENDATRDPLAAAIESVTPPPVFVAVVDVSASEDFLETVRAALHAALAALPEDALFGLVAFADTIGAYVLATAQPHVRHIPIPATGGEALALAEAGGLARMLVPVGACATQIERAIEMVGRSNDIAGSMSSVRCCGSSRCCGLGAVVHALVDAFSASPALAAPRLLLFLGSRPNLAAGALPQPASPVHKQQEASGTGAEALGADDQQLEDDYVALLSARSYFEALAHDAACLGATVFLYALSAEPLGLSALQGLVTRTGGILNHYTDVDDCSLPEDVFKQLSCQFASQGMLRLRTSPELTVTHAYGAIAKDETIEQLYHLAGCHDETAVAFSLGFASTTGFSDENEAFPTIQIAYSYTTLVPSTHCASFDDETEVRMDALVDGCRTPVRWRRVRRLRVQTTQLPIARNLRQVFEGVNDRVLMTLLMHKVVVAIETEGYQEGRLLLQDWLVRFLAKYQHHYAAHPSSVLQPEQMCPSIAALPRWVYGLLRGPLLSSNTPLSAHKLTADLRTWMYTLYRSLPVVDLCTAIHPLLSAWRSPEVCEHRSVPLTWAAVERTGCRLFLLDAYTHVFVCALVPLTAASSPLPSGPGEDRASSASLALGFDFPPLKTSALWKEVLKLKQQRLRTARIVVCQSGTGPGLAFETYIDGDASAQARAEFCSGWRHQPRFTFHAFLSFLHSELTQDGRGLDL